VRAKDRDSLGGPVDQLAQPTPNQLIDILGFCLYRNRAWPPAAMVGKLGS
jgi:hypothetical protein